MKTRLLHNIYMNPFAALNHEDPYTHLTKFYELSGTFGAYEIEVEVVFMRLFPYSLIEKANEWYLDQLVQTITNLNILEEMFLYRFFPYNRFLASKTPITTFAQGSIETLYEAWEWYKLILRKFCNHGFNDLTQSQIFHNSLQPQPKSLLDATPGGSLMSKSEKEAIYIIERIPLNNHQVQYDKGSSKKKHGILELGTKDAILAQNKLHTQTLEELTKQLSKLPQHLKKMYEVPVKPQHVSFCELFTDDHPIGFRLPANKEVKYIGNQQRQAPYQGSRGY